MSLAQYAFSSNQPSKIVFFSFLVAIVLPIDFLRRKMRIEGFISRKWNNRTAEFQKVYVKWNKEVKLKYRETVTQGFENTLNAFVDLLKGGNIGKSVVKV